MKAIVLDEYGGPEALRLTDLPEPKVAPGEVLIRVKAAGVNPVDWKLAAGGLDGLMETHFPLIPGWDVAGIVERVGFDVEEYAPGDEVYGYIRKDTAQHGGYAELVSAHVRMLARKPVALSWDQAAGVPLAGLTALQAIDRVGIGAGDTALIHAAAGGVGSLGVQIAVARGARVIGTASERNHEFVRQLGAEPVTYGPGLADRVAGLAPDGVDAALDFFGADAVDTSLQLIEKPERLASIANPEAAAKGGHYVWVRPDSAGLAVLAGLADSGRLTVHVDQVLPLAEAAEAWRLNQLGHTRGKLVLSTEDR
ncbi:NADPH:quinone reductase [Saccharopolyspora kobensis]|uniref:NADPH:quinone reductase n=1 Tax=Saccharopolyspora kobensis TaxID=146035 RepID=A0A1H5SSP7_9PSEU|nr:NADP-dependent oxidoreductase [Saccharopolyspora kobensis]SEF53589.1 NADPH:quinone reductase [Saccharopolyspora kobensis]SFC53838.1 NADPH:quinone reductase [Saccharopolyspora kobensis]